jgi:hypothetical protein
MLLDDGRMTETCCGNNIRRGGEELLLDGTGSIPHEVTGLFQLPQPFQLHYGPGVDSASNKNEYQESSLG